MLFSKSQRNLGGQCSCVENETAKSVKDGYLLLTFNKIYVFPSLAVNHVYPSFEILCNLEVKQHVGNRMIQQSKQLLLRLI